MAQTAISSTRISPAKRGKTSATRRPRSPTTPSRISSHQFRWSRAWDPGEEAGHAIEERPRAEQATRIARPTPALERRARRRQPPRPRAGCRSTTSGRGPRCRGRRSPSVRRRGVRRGGAWRRPPRAAASTRRRPPPRPRRRRLVGRRRLAIAAHLADVLERGGADLVITGRESVRSRVLMLRHMPRG